MNIVSDVWREVLLISVRASALIAVVLAIRLLLRRWLPAGVIFGLWLLIAGVLLLPWRAPLPNGFGEKLIAKFVPAKKTAMLQPISAAREGKPETSLLRAYDFTGDIKPWASVQADSVQATDTIMVKRSWWEHAALIWFFGAAVLLVLRATRIVGFRWQLRRTTRPGELRLERMLERCGGQLGVNPLPKMLTTSLVGGPALCGLWRPCLLMPPGLIERLSHNELEWVLRHELAHLQRRDLWTQALLQLACAVHWFNPLVWLAVRLARHDCELACDASVLRQTPDGEVQAYGGALLRVLTLAAVKRGTPTAVGILEGRRRLFDRVEMMARHRRTGKWGALSGGVLLAGVAAVGFSQEQAVVPPKASLVESSQAVPADKPAVAQPVVRLWNNPSVSMTIDQQLHQAAREEREKRRREWMEQATFELRAVGEVGGVPVAVIDVYGDPYVVIKGSGLFRRQVWEINLAAKEVTISGFQSPEKMILHMDRPRPVEFPEIKPPTVDHLVHLSAKNPEALFQSRLPLEVVLAWPKLNPQSKEAILLSYLRSGVVVNVAGNPDGSYDGMNTNMLFSARIAKIRRDLADAFIVSLTEAQRRDYRGGLVPAIRFMDSPDGRKHQIDDAQKVIEAQKRVVANLTPEQQKLYDAWQEYVPKPPVSER